MFRFTIRDVLWLTTLAAVLVAWLLDHAKTRIDWERVRENERLLQTAKQQLYWSEVRANASREQKDRILRAAARFGVTTLDVEPETRIHPALQDPDF